MYAFWLFTEMPTYQADQNCLPKWGPNQWSCLDMHPPDGSTYPSTWTAPQRGDPPITDPLQEIQKLTEDKEESPQPEDSEPPSPSYEQQLAREEL